MAKGQICENCAVVVTLEKEQRKNGQYKDSIQSLRIINRKLQTEISKNHELIKGLTKRLTKFEQEKSKRGEC